MIFNKKVQYGMLFSLYLSRSGRATVEEICENLNLSKGFLDQIARKLRVAGLIKSTRGPGGGHELVGNPLVKDLVRILNPMYIMKSKDLNSLSYGNIEKRSLFNYISTIKSGTSTLLDTPIRDMVNQTVSKEVQVLESLDISSIGGN